MDAPPQSVDLPVLKIMRVLARVVETEMDVGEGGLRGKGTDWGAGAQEKGEGRGGPRGPCRAS